MYIGIANIDLREHSIFEKKYNIKKGERFIAMDGVLHNDIKAKNVSILKIVKDKDDSEMEDYLILENETNSKFIDIEINGENVESYKQLKEENEALKERLEAQANENEALKETKRGRRKQEA